MYFLLIKIYGLFNDKAKAWVQGRKNWEQELAKVSLQVKGCIWFHCASLGEFEQGRPLIELFKKQHPNKKILLTFFSPSGYLIRKNYALADYVCYLPTDTPNNAKQFLNIVQPKLVVFVKYEWWYYFSKAISNRNIPFYNISGIFRKEGVFFKPYGVLHRQILSFYTHFFVQDDLSKTLLESIHIKNLTVSGDTRFDRVWQNKQQVKSLPFLEQFKNNQPILIGGSTYAKEDSLLIELMQVTGEMKNFKYIIVPHEIDAAYCQQLKNRIPLKAKLHSEIQSHDDLSLVQVLIIDRIGLLNQCYAYVDYAIVGGGFGKGIHNILEAVVFGLPVFFGANYIKAKEAIDLVETGLAFSVQISKEINSTIAGLEKDEKRKNQHQVNLSNYVEERTGATKLIYNEITSSQLF